MSEAVLLAISNSAVLPSRPHARLDLQAEQPDSGDRVLNTAFMHPSYVDTPGGSNLAICTPKNVYNVRFGAVRA